MARLWGGWQSSLGELPDNRPLGARKLDPSHPVGVNFEPRIHTDESGCFIKPSVLVRVNQWLFPVF